MLSKLDQAERWVNFWKALLEPVLQWKCSDHAGYETGWRRGMSSLTANLEYVTPPFFFLFFISNCVEWLLLLSNEGIDKT